MCSTKSDKREEKVDAVYQGGTCFHCGVGPHLCECPEYEDEDVIISAAKGGEEDVLRPHQK